VPGFEKNPRLLKEIAKELEIAKAEPERTAEPV
jgi:hypothetical protein